MGWPPMADGGGRMAERPVVDSGGRIAEDGKSAEALDSGLSTLDSARIFVLSVAPMARWCEGARVRNGTIREINAALAANAGAEGYVFVDLHPVLADGDGFLRGDVTSDGVHLNARGYEVVLEKLKASGLF
jgi:hypothetical protein